MSSEKTNEQLVKELIDQQEPQAWQKDLWAIFGGYMCNHANEGNNPKIHDLFWDQFQKLWRA